MYIHHYFGDTMFIKKGFLIFLLLMCTTHEQIIFASESQQWIYWPINTSKLYDFDTSISGRIRALLIKSLASSVNLRTKAFFYAHELFYGKYIHVAQPLEDIDKVVATLKEEYLKSNSDVKNKLDSYQSIDELVNDLKDQESRLESELIHETEQFYRTSGLDDIADNFKKEYEKLVNLDYKSCGTKYTVHERSPITDYIKELMKKCGIDHAYVSIKFTSDICTYNAQVVAYNNQFHNNLCLPSSLLVIQNQLLLTSVILHEISHILLNHVIKQFLVHFVEKNNKNLQFPREISSKFFLFLRTHELLSDVYLFQKLHKTCPKKMVSFFIKDALRHKVTALSYERSNYSIKWKIDPSDSQKTHPNYLLRFAYLFRIEQLLNQQKGV